MSCAATPAGGTAMSRTARQARIRRIMIRRWRATRWSVYWRPSVEKRGSRMTRNLAIGTTFLAIVAALGAGQAVLEKSAAAQGKGTVQAPRYEVDPMWPKPLPKHWLLGNVIGVGVDSQDHVWIIHRQASLEAMENYAAANPPGPKRRAGVVESECCQPAPPVLEFDEAGNLIGHWGGPGEGYDWPETNHGIFIDYKGNVWIGGNGRPAPGSAGQGAGRAG